MLPHRTDGGPENDTRQSDSHVPAPSYRQRLLDLHRELVKTASVTGHENNVNDVLIKYLLQNGFRVERQVLSTSRGNDVDRDRYNVLAWPVINPANSQTESSHVPRLLITAHLDTVPPFIPYGIETGEITAKTRISGRGSVDAKASVVTQIVAVEELLASGRIKPDDVMLLYVVGEEEGGDGMRHFSCVLNSPQQSNGSIPSRLPPSFESVIFGEPTENKLARGHKGLLICNIVAKGVAGHSGYPWLGRSANESLMRALVKALNEDLGSSEQFGHTTVNVGVFHGGVGGNVIAEEASASLVLRVATGPEDTGHQKARARLLQILEEVDKDAFSVEWLGGYGAVPCHYDVEGESKPLHLGDHGGRVPLLTQLNQVSRRLLSTSAQMRQF